MELFGDDPEIIFDKTEFFEIEINPPVTEEDIRYVQLEEMIFMENQNPFGGKSHF